MAPSTDTTSRRHTARLVMAFAGVLLLAIAIWTARDIVRDALTAMARADPAWIAGALALQVIVYGALGALLVRLQEPDGDLGWLTCSGVALVVFGLGGIMPISPAEGMTAATVELNRRGMPATRAAGMLVLSEWVRFLALATLFAIDRVVAVLNGRSLNLGVGPVVFSSLIIIAMTVGAAAFVRSPRAAVTIAGMANRLPHRRRGRDEVRERSREVHETVVRLLGSRANRLAVMSWASIGWIADAVSLALCVKAMGDELGIDAVLLAYVIAAAVALVPFLPGGLGAVEVAVPTVMHRFGVPLDTALAATLAWRGLSLIAPAVGGSVALLALRHQSLTPPTGTTSTGTTSGVLGANQPDHEGDKDDGAADERRDRHE